MATGPGRTRSYLILRVPKSEWFGFSYEWCRINKEFNGIPVILLMYHDDNLENCSNIEDGVIIKLLDMKIL